MPIEDTDIPIIDNQTDFKIDNQVERIYLYRVISATNSNFVRVGERFYKLNQKNEGLDTFISEYGTYYIYAFRISGTNGYWILSPILGAATNGLPTRPAKAPPVSTFFPYGLPVEGTYTSIGGSVVIGKINTDIISE